MAGLALLLWLAPLWRGFDAVRQLWPLWCVAALLAVPLAAVSRDRRLRWAVLPLAAAIVAPGLGDTLRGLGEALAEPDHPAGFDLHVATQNMWVRNTAPDRLVTGLSALDPDILALQEASGASREAAVALAGRYPFTAGCRSTRLVSRYDILESGCVRSPVPVDRASSIPCDYEVPPATWARIRLPDGREIVAVSVHMTWPFPGATHDCQRGGLAAALAQMPHDRMIVMGDFNAAAPSRALARMGEALDLERRSVGIATFPSEGRFREAGWPVPPVAPMVVGIDHVFAGPAWDTVAIAAGPDTGSDHRPLVATLRLRD